MRFLSDLEVPEAPEAFGRSAQSVKRMAILVSATKAGIRSRVDEPQRDSVRFLDTNDLTARKRVTAHLLISCVIKFSGS
jgi:hypothetical protein